MAYLMRKITPLRWTQEQPDVKSTDDINAESLGDLCADENAISTWYVGGKSEEEIIKAVTALSSGFRSLDELNVVFIDDSEIESAGLNISSTKGDTKISEYADLHRDIDHLKVCNLVSLAEIILKNIWEGNTQAINAEQLSIWILQQIDMGKLKFTDLDKNFRIAFASKVKRLINKGKLKFEDLNETLRDDLETQWNLNKKKTTSKYEMECSRYGHSVSA